MYLILFYTVYKFYYFKLNYWSGNKYVGEK